MSTYTLNNSATDIDDALQKVVAVTTTPLDGNPNMVTSGGVKAYVDTQDTALETQILANTAAIVSSGLKTATLTAANGSKYYNNNSATFYIPFTEEYDAHMTYKFLCTSGVAFTEKCGDISMLSS